MHLASVAGVNHLASSAFSGGKTLNFVSKPLDDKLLISGICNDSCSKDPDATFSSLLLLKTLTSYLHKRESDYTQDDLFNNKITLLFFNGKRTN